MQDLKRLAKIVAANSPKVLPTVDLKDQTGLEGKLCQFIINNDNLSDEKACTFLYGEQKLTPSYRMLKSRLRKKLLNTVLFTELTDKKYRKCRVWFIECSELIHQANKLRVMGEVVLVSKLVDQSIQLAQKAELNDMLVKAYELKLSIDLFSHNRNLFEKNLKLMQHYHNLETREYEAQIIYNKLKFELNLNVSNRRKQRDICRKPLLELKKLWEATNSSKIYDQYHLLRIGYHEIIGDFEGIIGAIAEAETLRDKGRINKYWFNHHFNSYIKAYAYLRLGKYGEGLAYSKTYLDRFVNGTINWFAFLENYLLLALHGREYSQAIYLCCLADANGALEHPLDAFRERWSLFLRYVHLFSTKSDRVDIVKEHSKDFEASNISKDKDGLNFSLLVLEYIERLPSTSLEDSEQYEARFNKYASKYLKGEMGARARLFIKLLILSMKEEGTKLERKSAPVLEKLKTTPQPRDPIAEVEIVPYEHLWELVLEIMQNKGQK